MVACCGVFSGESAGANVPDHAPVASAAPWARSYALDTPVAQPPTADPAVLMDKDPAGLRRDTAYLLSYQVVAIGIIYSLPESISNWSDEQKESYSLADWWDNVSNPQWDTDKYYLNYILHPYWGAAYYVRARENGYGERASFWYSAAMSAAFEFGAEALFEQPSIQDLVVTPVAGAILGEQFMRWRQQVAERHAPGEAMSRGDRLLLVLTDPIGAINRQVQSWLGLSGGAHLRPYYALQRVGAPLPYPDPAAQADRVYGLQLDYRW